MPIVNVKGFKAPLARKVHVVGLVIMLPEVGHVRPKLGAAKHPEMVPTSAGAKPLPDTVTTVPTAPDLGLREIVGPVTVKGAEPQSPAAQPEPPFTVIVYGPGVVLATTNDAETLPPEIEHV